MKTPTIKTINAAFNKAVRKMINKHGDLETGLLQTHIDAGTALAPGKKGERHGVQFFVRAVRFSEKRLKQNPQSGGLLVNL